MADQFTYAKLPSDPCLTQEQMFAYIDGTLSAADQHACEKHIADCEMCEDALEGLSLVKERSRLASPIIKEVAPTGKVVPLQPAQPKLRLYYAAAAVLVLVLGSVFFLKNMASPDAESSLADNSAKADSIEMTAPVVMEKLDCLQNVVSGTGVSGENRDGDASLRPTISQKEPEVYRDFAKAMANESLEGEKSEDFADIPAEEERNEIMFDANEISLAESPVEDEKLKEAEVKEEDKKNTFWDRTKAAVPQTGPERSEKKQSLTKDNAGTESRQTTGQPEAPKQDADAPPANVPAGGAVGTADAQGAETISMADSVFMSGNAVNLDQSYQTGLDLLNAGQANAAIAMFDKVLADKNHPQYEDAEFQKANALIKANRKAEAKVLLQSIEAKKGKHANEATELLKTL